MSDKCRKQLRVEVSAIKGERDGRVGGCSTEWECLEEDPWPECDGTS
jgi:hypothetical protein